MVIHLLKGQRDFPLPLGSLPRPSKRLICHSAFLINPDGRKEANIHSFFFFFFGMKEAGVPGIRLRGDRRVPRERHLPTVTGVGAGGLRESRQKGWGRPVTRRTNSRWAVLPNRNKISNQRKGRSLREERTIITLFISNRPTMNTPTKDFLYRLSGGRTDLFLLSWVPRMVLEKCPSHPFLHAPPKTCPELPHLPACLLHVSQNPAHHCRRSGSPRNL